MQSVVISGIGFVTCIGNNKETVLENLKNLNHGIRHFPQLDAYNMSVRLAAPILGFNTDSDDQEDWSFPSDFKIRQDRLRLLPPHGLYALYAVEEAIRDAALTTQDISNERTGLFTASAGSVSRTYYNLHRMRKLGPQRCSPMGIISSIAGTLNFNLVTSLKILGASTGFVSACASSGHAVGYACEEILSGRQDRMIVVGAEDLNTDTIIPFASMRVISQSQDPDTASRPFDQKRDGFVPTGGAVVLVLESEAEAKRRSVTPYARIRGWGQSSDGYHVAIAHPEGAGLARAMSLALKNAGVNSNEVDYLNAHATSTPMGDTAELKAIKTVFGANGESGRPSISSTKALTGHGLSLSSIMELSFCALSSRYGFMPGSAHIENIDPEAEHMNILRKTVFEKPNLIMSNSSGFGGANVSIVVESMDH
jgi:3-oxoacyl-[acyl-carrier-protein] synthase-1